MDKAIRIALLAGWALFFVGVFSGCTNPTAPELADCPPGFELVEALVYPSGKLVAVCQEITFVPAGEVTP